MHFEVIFTELQENVLINIKVILLNLRTLMANKFDHLILCTIILVIRQLSLLILYLVTFINHSDIVDVYDNSY